MTEFLSFYLLCGFAVNMVAIFRFHSNPPAIEVMGATLMWPLVLLSLISSFFRPKDDDIG